jgi:drug/metabolite transporter (DMT)-like permease
MRLLIVLQALLAVIYYITSPFEMNWSLWITLALNLLALGYLWKYHRITHEIPTREGRIARLVFTITLILMEFLILFTTTPVSPDGILVLINDSEVFVTGILIGVLWHREILGKARVS